MEESAQQNEADTGEQAGAAWTDQTATDELDVDNTSQLASDTAEPRPTRLDISISPPPSTSKPASPLSHATTPSTSVRLKATPLDSQPMTALSSSSSLPGASGSHPHETSGPSPYGTRSRNRIGNARPNYAEDREMDMEYEWTSTKKGQATASAWTGSPQVTESDKGSGPGRRRSMTGTNGAAMAKANGVGAAATKDLPGMSTFSVNADANAMPQHHSKKRKAPGGHHGSSNVGKHASAAASHKKSAHASHAGSGIKDTNMYFFLASQAYPKHGKLVADDGTRFSINDYVYLVCEPPGEPYYLARIMEFLHADNDSNSPVESLRINWVYRPRDIGRKTIDSRQVYASMHSDTCPLTSLRGKCQISHRSRIGSMEEYRKMKDSFWFSQIYDRYIHRFYDVIPTSQVINVPEKVKKVLDERWTYVIAEGTRGKELTSDIKRCKRCNGYCASTESVDCAMCKNTYHMNCVRPPLLKKPARGFAWSCGPCSRKQERKLEARNTPLVGEKTVEGDEEENLDEEEDEHGVGSNTTTNSSSGNPMGDGGAKPATAEQLAQAKLWPYRYLGVHCNPEDALDYDDRIYPRASSRLGPRHQANVIIWHGRPLEFIKPAEIKKKYVKGNSHKKDAKLSKETVAAMEADKLAREKRPKWVIDEPSGFVHRGSDHPRNDPAITAKVCFRLPKVGERSSRGGDDSSSLIRSLDTEDREQLIEDYMADARRRAPSFGLAEYSTNFLDKALELLYINDFAAAPALKQLQNLDLRKDLKEPKLNKEELKRFEEGVAKHGTNLYEVSRHVGKPQKHGEIVRFYYMWKKTARGRQIWGSYEGRKSKKQAKQFDSTLVDDVAHDCDDSAFDNEKAVARKRGFECKFCSTRHSRYWRRAPGVSPGTTVLADPVTKGSKEKPTYLMVALCQRCASLWRRYAIQWENIDEVAKKVAQAGGKAWKRKMDEELLIELGNANDASSGGMGVGGAAHVVSARGDAATPPPPTAEPEPTRKKLKTASSDRDGSHQAAHAVPADPPKKKLVERPPEPPLVPEQPRIKELPCAVCLEMEPLDERRFCCRHCRLTVHRDCYGIAENRSASKWTCDMCSNDVTNQVSTLYECVLCPMKDRDVELMEPPKSSHKKKTEREREKERLEKELVIERTAQYIQKQHEAGRPPRPREALKKTAGNHWVHVVCAVWNPYIKFGDAKALAPSEGLGAIPPLKFNEVCKLCKDNDGVCMACHKCSAPFHVTCAQRAGYQMGFDVTPVKGSRRDIIPTVALGGESGSLGAVVYCKEHSVKSILHPISEGHDHSALNALQQFVRHFKQADLSLTGTARKAAFTHSSLRGINQIMNVGTGRRCSLANAPSIGGPSSGSAPATRSSRVSPAAVTVKSEEFDEDGDRILHLNESQKPQPTAKKCAICDSDTSPRWHPHAGSEPDPMHRPHGRDVDHHVSTNASPVRTGGHGPSAAQSADGKRNGSMAVDPIASPGAHEDYRCHKCHLRKMQEPLPTPYVDPVTSYSRDGGAVDEVPAASSSATWPPLPPAHAIQHDPWPGSAGSAGSAGHHLANGISRSPPSHVGPHGPPAYGLSQPHYYSNGYEGRPPHYPASVSHPMNGLSPAYSTASRLATGALEPGPYAGPNASHAGYGHPATTAANGTRSPPAVLYRVPQAPPGPPRASENPFLLPHYLQSSPRPRYLGGRGGSPRLRGVEERPTTPITTTTTMEAGHERNGSWGGSEGPMANGASASPSLRNLLH